MIGKHSVSALPAPVSKLSLRASLNPVEHCQPQSEFSMEKNPFPLAAEASKEEVLAQVVMRNLDEACDAVDDVVFAAAQLRGSLRKLLRYLDLSPA